MKGKAALGLGCFWLLALACGAESKGNGTDGHTHWLSRCVIDEDCEQGLECLCGACTSECSESAECDAASNGRAPICSALTCGESSGASACEAPATAAPSGDPPVTSLGIGDVCVPSDEYAQDFTGYSIAELSIAANSQCASELCLVNHFQGRVTCPYGQSAGAEPSCRVAGSTLLVDVSVAPQLVERRPEDAVYCSCRCDGPNPGEDYCECPDGLACTSLIEFSQPGFEEYTGSYCVKEGTQVDPDVLSRELCTGDACGDSEGYWPGTAGVLPPETEVSPGSVNVFVDQLLAPSGEELGCIPRALSTVDGALSCAIVEAAPDLACDGLARAAVAPDLARAIYAALARGGYCADSADCEASLDLCGIVQLTSADAPEQAASCLDDVEAIGDGFCYLDTSAGQGNPELLEHCPATAQRSIRFVGAGVPAAGSVTFIACIGAL